MKQLMSLIHCHYHLVVDLALFLHSPFYSDAEPTGPGTLQLKGSPELEVDCLRALPDEVQQRITWRNPLAYLGSHAAVSLQS